MPKQTRSPEEVEQVRKSIIDGALDLIVEEGFDGLSMSRLGSRLHMTGANLYNYFENRDSLVIAIHRKVFRLLHGELLEAVSETADPGGRVEKLIRAFVAFGTRNPNIYEMMFTTPRLQYRDYVGTPLEEQAYEEYLSSLEGLLLAGQTLEDFLTAHPDKRTGDTRFMTIKLMSQIHGIISLHNSRILYDMTDDPEGTLESIVRGTLDTLINGRPKSTEVGNV